MNEVQSLMWPKM